jgi:phage baseplate assembly protein W
MRTGLDRRTGQVLQGWAHCVQSIAHILETTIGSMPLARDYGSDAPSRTDRPASPREIAGLTMAVAQALRLHEPAFRLRKIDVRRVGADGVIEIDYAGDFYPFGHVGDFSVIERDVAGAASITLAREAS